MKNSDIAKVMGWSIDKDEFGFISQEYDILETWDGQPDYNKWCVVKLLQAKMVEDGYYLEIHITPHYIRAKALGYEWFEASEDTEPAAIVSLFKKVYGGGR